MVTFLPFRAYKTDNQLIIDTKTVCGLYKNMPKNVSFVLFLRLFCVKDSYNFNTNKHFNTLFFPFSHILYQWLTLRRVFPFLKIVVYMAFHNAIVLYPTENLMIINDIHKLITLL